MPFRLGHSHSLTVYIFLELWWCGMRRIFHHLRVCHVVKSPVIIKFYICFFLHHLLSLNGTLDFIILWRIIKVYMNVWTSMYMVWHAVGILYDAFSRLRNGILTLCWGRSMVPNISFSIFTLAFLVCLVLNKGRSVTELSCQSNLILNKFHIRFNEFGSKDNGKCPVSVVTFVVWMWSISELHCICLKFQINVSYLIWNSIGTGSRGMLSVSPPQVQTKLIAI